MFWEQILNILKITLYSLASGTIVECKMQKKIYNVSPINTGEYNFL